MAKAHLRTVNGKPAYQAVRVLTLKQFVEDPETGAQVIEKFKKRITGTGGTKQEAETRLEENLLEFQILMRQQPNNPNLRPQKRVETITLNELIDKWLEYRSRDSGRREPLDDATYALYLQNIDLHIRPHIGDRRLAVLRRADLDTFIWVTLQAKKREVKDPDTGERVTVDEPALGFSVRRTIYSILKQVLDLGVKEDLLKFNPLAGVEKPITPRMSDEHEKSIIEHHYIPRRVMKALWGDAELGRWVLAFMGLRSAERLGVELSSFRYLDDPSRTTELVVNRQLARNRVSGEWFIKPTTKTKSGKRILMLPPEVSDHLRLWKAQREKWKKEGLKAGTWKPDPGLEDLLFVQPNGRAIRLVKDRYAWGRLLERLKLPHHRLHDMRHMVATALGKNGVAPSIAGIILGHSDDLMVFYYQHLSKSETVVPLAEVAREFSKDAVRVVPDENAASEPFELVDAPKEIIDALLGEGSDEGENPLPQG